MRYTTGSGGRNKLEGASGMAEMHVCVCVRVSRLRWTVAHSHSETGGQLLFPPSHPFMRSRRRRAGRGLRGS